MATTKTPAAPAPKPASTASVKAEPVAIAPKKSGFDPMRPVRYLSGLVSGTVKNGLDKMAGWGRTGSKIGAALAALGLVSGALSTGGIGLMIIPVGWAVGLAVGAIAGGVVGAATGGVNGVQREHRREKYATELMRKAEAKSKPQPKVDYRDAHRGHKGYGEAAVNHKEKLLDRLFMQDRLVEEEYQENFGQKEQTHFRDMVNQSRANGDYGKGL